MHILWMLIIGLVAGALAKLIMPGKDPGGIFVTMLIGVAGSFIAGWLGRMVGHYQYGDRPGLIASVIGSIILLGVYRLFLRATHRTTLSGGTRGTTT
jgi:uncharacterized membrane protein YeaQ/YmgE (transglycosylase-associated protein family)